MKIGRRGLLGLGLGGLVATLLPEVASARGQKTVDATDTPWQWQPRDAREMTDEERIKYMPQFAADISAAEASFGKRDETHPPSMSISKARSATIIALGTPLGSSRIYTRHIELDEFGNPSRAATTIFFASEEKQTIALHSMGSDVRGAVQSRNDFEARAACAPGTHSCRACSEFNSLGILACCGGCAWATWNWLAFSSCALVLCSLCASQNCLRWTYACCPDF